MKIARRFNGAKASPIIHYLKPGQVEVHSNGSLHLNRVAIEDIRAVAPLPHGVERSGDEHRVTGDGREFNDVALFINDGLQNNRALNAALFGLLRIRRDNLVDQVAFSNPSGNPYSI